MCVVRGGCGLFTCLTVGVGVILYVFWEMMRVSCTKRFRLVINDKMWYIFFQLVASNIFPGHTDHKVRIYYGISFFGLNSTEKRRLSSKINLCNTLIFLKSFKSKIKNISIIILFV